MNKLLLTILVIGLLIATTACSNVQTSNAPTGNVQTGNTPVGNVQTSNVRAIAEIKNNASLGKTFTVQGIVENNVKTGSISGYRLKDGTDSIPVSSQTLPKINTTVTVTGIVQKSSYFGYYIVAVE